MSDITITEKLVKEFLEERGEPFSSGYIDNLENVFYNILIPDLPKEKNLTPAMISKALKTIIRHGPRKGEKISTTTQMARLGYVKIYLNWLLGKRHKDVLAFSDYMGTIRKTVSDKEPRIVDPDIVRKMVLNSPFNYEFLIWIGIKTAGRRESLTSLNKKDYFFMPLEKASKWFDRKTYKELLDKYQPEQEITEITREDKWHGTNKQQITVPLDIEETIKFKEYLTKRREKELFFIEKYQRTKAEKYQKYRDKIITDPNTGEQIFFVDNLGEYLFWNSKGFRMKPKTVSNTINNIATRLDIDFQTHDTRRRRIQELYAMGIREEIIKKISGHSKKGDTIKRYYDPQKVTVYSEIFSKGKNHHGE